MADAPGPGYYEPPKGAEDLPCECERPDIASSIRRAIEKAIDSMGAGIDWRRDCDIALHADQIAGAVEYGLCHGCAREAAGKLRRPQA